MSYANNKGADEPVHPRSLISAFVVRCLDSVMSLVSVTNISSLMLAAVAAQAVCVWPGRKLPKSCFVVLWLKYNHHMVEQILKLKNSIIYINFST